MANADPWSPSKGKEGDLALCCLWDTIFESLGLKFKDRKKQSTFVKKKTLFYYLSCLKRLHDIIIHYIQYSDLILEWRHPMTAYVARQPNLFATVTTWAGLIVLAQDRWTLTALRSEEDDKSFGWSSGVGLNFIISSSVGPLEGPLLLKFLDTKIFRSCSVRLFGFGYFAES